MRNSISFIIDLVRLASHESGRNHACAHLDLLIAQILPGGQDLDWNAAIHCVSTLDAKSGRDCAQPSKKRCESFTTIRFIGKSSQLISARDTVKRLGARSKHPYQK